MKIDKQGDSKRNSPIGSTLIIMGVLFIFPFVYMGGALKSNAEALTKPSRVRP
jgi:hypothetical protein